MTKKKLSPAQKIMRAAKRGTGLRLTADQVWQLSASDIPVETQAASDDMENEDKE